LPATSRTLPAGCRPPDDTWRLACSATTRCILAASDHSTTNHPLLPPQKTSAWAAPARASSKTSVSIDARATLTPMGKTGCAPHPRSRVLLRIARDAHEHTGSAGASRPSLRNGFTAYFVLFPENGSFASVAPKRLSLLEDLTPAPRRQNHTTSPYASATLVSHGIRVHRISPRVSDDGQRPSSRRETGAVMPLIWVGTEAEYFRFSAIIGLT
jgi:hypothetical protein